MASLTMTATCEQKVDTQFLLEQYRCIKQQIEGCKTQMRGLEMQAASIAKRLEVDKQANKG